MDAGLFSRRCLPAKPARLIAEIVCKRGTTLHHFDEVGLNAEHQPIIYSQEYYLPEAFSLELVRKITTAQEEKS